MTQFKKVPNTVTKRNEVQFSSKLIAVNDDARTYKNNDGVEKKYFLATVEFENASGQTVRKTASIPEKNMSYGMDVGNSYLTTATKDGDRIYLRLSHLVPVDAATVEDFGADLFEAVAAPSSVATQTT